MVAITTQGKEDCQRRRRRIGELLSSLTAALLPLASDPLKKPKIPLLNSFLGLG